MLELWVTTLIKNSRWVSVVAVIRNDVHGFVMMVAGTACVLVHLGFEEIVFGFGDYKKK